MKRKVIELVMVAGIGIFCVTGANMQAALTDGYTQYYPNYTVQNWTSGCGGFADLGGGEYETWVCSGESRCEMRWDNWPNQNTYNQFECDAEFSSDTQDTCIHQIKSNTGGEVIYLQVQSPGTLRNDNGSVFMSGMANTWFHINSMFNPANGDGKCYINGSLQVTRSYPTSDRAWYFKNGTYNNGIPSGHKSTAWFKNIKSWVYSGGGGGGGGFSGWYQIIDHNSGKNANVKGGATTNGAAVILYTTGTSANEEWEMTPTDSGYYQIVNRNSGKVMAVQGASTSDGAAVIQWSFGSAQNDQWLPVDLGNGYYNLQNRHSGLMLDVKGAQTTNDTPFEQYHSTGGNNQQFKFNSEP